MVEFKDDGTATTPGKPRENRDAESAVVADLVAVELDDAGLNLNAKRLPILARIYGAVMLLDGLATLPIMVISILYAVREILDGHVHVDAMSLTFILSAIHAVVLVVSAACLIVFGVMLLRNHRRYAGRWTYVLMPLTLADGMLSLALTGLGFNLLLPLIQMIILVVISVTADPSLSEERRLQRALRRMDDRDDYESAVAAGMLGRDQSGKGYIALDFFNIFWLFTIASVGGLIVETIYHMALYNGELQDRAGLLWGPFSPIYGCGAVLVTVCLNRLLTSPLRSGGRCGIGNRVPESPVEGESVLDFLRFGGDRRRVRILHQLVHGSGVWYYRVGLHRPMALNRRAYFGPIHVLLGTDWCGVGQVAVTATAGSD